MPFWPSYQDVKRGGRHCFVMVLFHYYSFILFLGYFLYKPMNSQSSFLSLHSTHIFSLNNILVQGIMQNCLNCIIDVCAHAIESAESRLHIYPHTPPPVGSLSSLGVVTRQNGPAAFNVSSERRSNRHRQCRVNEITLRNCGCLWTQTPVLLIHNLVI